MIRLIAITLDLPVPLDYAAAMNSWPPCLACPVPRAWAGAGRGGISFSLPILTLRMVCWRRSQQRRQVAHAVRSRSHSCRPDLRSLWPSFIAAVHEYALLLLDPDGHVLSWNHGAELIYGYRADEIVGRHCSLPVSATEDIEAGKPERELEIAAATGRFEEHRRARAEGWLAISRQRGDHRHPRARRRLARVRQDHPRHHGALPPPKPW